MSKNLETIKVLVVADGMYAGARALKGYASSGLGSPFYTVQSRRENAIRVGESRMPLDVFAAMDESSDRIRRGLDAKDLSTARRNALKLARAVEPLDSSTLWSSTSLTRKPKAWAAVPLGAGDENAAEVFATLLAEVERGRPSLDVLREVMLGTRPQHALIAVRMLRVCWPAIPDWYWHPALTIPSWVGEQIAELRAGTRARVRLEDDAIDEARLAMLTDRKLRGGARTVATNELRQRANLDRARGV